jgi:uncharacterized Tic20 family protein
MRPTSAERFIAIFAHLSALALGSGLIIPAVFWGENQKKSPWLRYQTLQALGYQSLGYTVWMLLYLLVIVVFMLALFILAALVPNAAQNETIPMIFSVILIVSAFGLLGIYFLLPVMGAIACGLGRDFRYPLLGRRLALALGYDSSNPDPVLDSAFEERFVAAMGHFAVIQPLWGLLAPAWFWLTHTQHSASLKFQSVQTTLYQLFVNLFYFGASIFSVVLGLASIAFFAAYGDLGEWNAVAGMLVWICLMSFVMLVMPLFHLLGQWAGLQILLGREYRYPLLGRWVEKFLK